MHPRIDLRYGVDACLVIATNPTMPSDGWSVIHAEIIPYTDLVKIAGKKLKLAMSIASKKQAFTEHAKFEARSPDNHEPFFQSPLVAVLLLKDKHWIIHCGKEPSPDMPADLPSVPDDEEAGTAFFALFRELERLHATYSRDGAKLSLEEIVIGQRLTPIVTPAMEEMNAAYRNVIRRISTGNNPEARAAIGELARYFEEVCGGFVDEGTREAFPNAELYSTVGSPSELDALISCIKNDLLTIPEFTAAFAESIEWALSKTELRPVDEQE